MTPEVETIRQDASFGTVLKYTNQTFKAVPNNISGFITKGDAKSMIGIKGKNVEYIVVANNNSALNIFRKSSKKCPTNRDSTILFVVIYSLLCDSGIKNHSKTH